MSVPSCLSLSSLLAAGRRVLAALVRGHAGRESRLHHRRPPAAARRAVGLHLRGASVWPAARPARLERAAPETAEAVIVGVAGQILELRLLLDGPVDQPHSIEDRDLENHGQEDDRYDLSHRGESTPTPDRGHGRPPHISRYGLRPSLRG